VLLTRNQVLDREIAVKDLQDQYASDPAFLNRFARDPLRTGRLFVGELSCRRLLVRAGSRRAVSGAG